MDLFFRRFFSIHTADSLIYVHKKSMFQMNHMLIQGRMKNMLNFDDANLEDHKRICFLRVL